MAAGSVICHGSSKKDFYIRNMVGASPWVPTTLSWPPYRAIARFTPGNGLPVARDLPISHIYTIKISAEISRLTHSSTVAMLNLHSPCFVNTNDHPPMIYDLNRFRCLLMISFLFDPDMPIIGFFHPMIKIQFIDQTHKLTV